MSNKTIEQQRDDYKQAYMIMNTFAAAQSAHIDAIRLVLTKQDSTKEDIVECFELFDKALDNLLNNLKGNRSNK